MSPNQNQNQATGLGNKGFVFSSHYCQKSTNTKRMVTQRKPAIQLASWNVSNMRRNLLRKKNWPTRKRNVLALGMQTGVFLSPKKFVIAEISFSSMLSLI